MSQENVEIVRRACSLDVRVDPEAVREVMDPKVEFWDHDIPDAGVYRGFDGLLQWQTDWARGWSSWDSETVELIDGGDCVVAIVRARAKGRHSGVEVRRVEGGVWTLCAGKVVRVDYYGSRADALKAVGLEE